MLLQPEEKIRELAEMVEKHCPIMDSLMREIPVAGNVEVVKDDQTSGPPTVVLSEITKA